MNLSGKRTVFGHISEKPEEPAPKEQRPVLAGRNLSGLETEEDDIFCCLLFLLPKLTNAKIKILKREGIVVKRTPLYAAHVKLGGKMIDFGGWELPVQYEGIIEEHQKVRNAAGIFDVSHMGEILVKGPDAEGFLEGLVTNSILKAKENQIVYSPMCYPNGGVVDDLLVYKYSREYYLLVVNASNTLKDFDWLTENKRGQVEIDNVSENFVQLAIQGPKAESILQSLTDTDLSGIRFFHFLPKTLVGGFDAIVSRTGYTGEDGFEIYLEAGSGEALWNRILEAGKEEGLVPVGLGARDTLRFEAALPLYGQEISGDISPLEAGLERFVKLGKESFTGKEALQEQRDKGLKRKLVGFEMVDRGIPRSHYEVKINGKTEGFVTTGSYSPTLKSNIGMALINSQYAIEGNEIDIEIRKKCARAKIISLPFYSKKYKK